MQEFIDINKRQHKFHIKTKVFGKEVEGDFICKYPSVLDSLKIQTMASKLLEGTDLESLLESAVLQAFKIATNEVLLIKRPDWYKVDDIDDFDTINAVYEEVKNFADTFRKEMYNKEDRRDSTDKGNSKTVESDKTI